MSQAECMRDGGDGWGHGGELPWEHVHVSHILVIIYLNSISFCACVHACVCVCVCICVCVLAVSAYVWIRLQHLIVGVINR